MSKPKVIVTRRWPDAVEDALKEHFDVELNLDDVPFDKAALMDALRRADALFPTVTDRIDADVLAAAPRRCRLIGNFGVGYNNIDVEAAKAQGITVTNTPDVLTDTTADLAMALLLAVARRVGEGERHVRAGDWSGWRPTHMMGTQVTGKTLGLIGIGRIGGAVAKKAGHGFDMTVQAYDPFPPPTKRLTELGVTLVDSPEKIFETSDFVSIHCPATAENRHLVNAERLASMKPSAFLINTARGDIVDEAALVEALKSKKIAGAGLDVFEREPVVTKALLTMENTVLLPHLGSATTETREAMGFRVMENALAFFGGREPGDRVA
ncbi:MAG: D-glycerate dehydrogenase [Alphaproteobacteria bacterium]